MRGETASYFHTFRVYPFQSTPLMRGETLVEHKLPLHREISIHSPHARGDSINL